MVRRRIPRATLPLLVVSITLAVGPSSRADDPNPFVRFETPLGVFEVELFPDDAPATVANFLKYVDDGDYDDSFIHRSVPGFIVQGGGFSFADGSAVTVPTDPPVVNEFKRSNLRGTIAMAKVGGNPNSATSQWFINLANNASNLDAQNGGFTVFGQVVGNGMQVVDALARVPIFNTGGAFAELPLLNYTPGNPIRRENLLITEIGDRGSTPTPSLLLRRSTNRSWFSYRLTFDDVTVTIEEKGSLSLTRSAAFETVSRSDFDGDGEPDILLRDTSEARAGGWSLATLVGKKITSEGELPVGADSDWNIVASEDFDGDGKADLLLRNALDGSWMVYLLEAQTVADEGSLDLSSDLGDTVAGTGDFDGDGRSDVLLRRANGSWLLYLLDGTAAPKLGRPKITTSARSLVESLADFDGDGRADVLLRDNNGRWTVYLLDGAKVRSKGAVALTEDLTFTLFADADFNGDGKADALLRGADGTWLLYALDGKTVLGEGAVELTDDTDYGIVSTDDFNGDGKADVLLRHADGRWLLYTLDGTGPTVLGTAVPKLSTSKSWVPQVD